RCFDGSYQGLFVNYKKPKEYSIDAYGLFESRYLQDVLNTFFHVHSIFPGQGYPAVFCTELDSNSFCFLYSYLWFLLLLPAVYKSFFSSSNGNSISPGDFLNLALAR